jgi:asparagine synthase (glutamine-hydrolysing)
MCGFTGLLNLDHRPINPELIRAMNDCIRHRGPDDEGYLFVDTVGKKRLHCSGNDTLDELKQSLPGMDHEMHADLALGFRRLSILDLSSCGHQPMQDESGRYWIVFNGEIYNYIELREELKQSGYSFRSGTDTEVILNAFKHWGEDCLHRFNGMWAFVIFDSHSGNLFFSRDRFGIKPLYYVYLPNKMLAFASEIKPLLLLLPFSINYSVVSDYLGKEITNHGGETFFSNIQQLLPGSKASLTAGKWNTSNYYKLSYKPVEDSFSKAVEHFRDLFSDAVRLRQRSDVPFGYALSGGVDSSSIVCTASRQKSIESDMTFSLIFPGRREDESVYIQEVINHTKFQSKFVTVGSQDFERDLDPFLLTQEEPFLGLSYYGEYKLRELIRNSGVTVSLEGQGADEIVTGYLFLLPHYYQDLIRGRRIATLRNEINAFSPFTGKNFSDTLFSYIKRYVGLEATPGTVKPDYYRMGEFQAGIPSRLAEKEYFSGSALNDALYDLLTRTSIPEQLVRADKNAMAFSVESRFPFLDYRLVEYAMGLPYQYKMCHGNTKYVLREAMREYLPANIYKRRDKVGFAVPNTNWLNQSLWEKINDGIASSSSIPGIDMTLFRKVYKDKRYLDHEFWKIASFVLWQYAFQEYSKTLPDKS